MNKATPPSEADKIVARLFANEIDRFQAIEQLRELKFSVDDAELLLDSGFDWRARLKANVLLVGPIGSGKTTSLKTILRLRRELRILSVEPGIESIMEPTTENLEFTGLTREEYIKLCHVHYIAPAHVSWETLRSNAEALNLFSMKVLADRPSTNKGDFAQFLEVYSTCTNFVCDWCKRSFGAVDEWGPDIVFAIDGLNGISSMSKRLVVGVKPVITQPEWGAAMENILNFVSKCTDDTRCNFILLSHVAREADEVNFGTRLGVDTLGVKLAPKIPKNFDEVIKTVRSGKKFTWSTAAEDMDLKSRRLPIADDLEPDFALLFGKAREEDK